MLSLIISLTVGLAAGFGTFAPTHHIGWSIFAGVFGFLLCSFLVNRFFTKKLQAVYESVQKTRETAQLEANKLITRAQSTGKGGSPKMIQKKVQKLMDQANRDSLVILDQAQPLYRWALLAKRQVTSYKMQFNYFLKNYKEVDRLMPAALIWDPVAMAMKMAREYVNDSPDLEKTYKKGARKFKGEKGLLVHSTYIWIQVKRKEFGRAQEIITQVKEKVENEGLERNWQALANNRPNQYSNSFLGDEWYALDLEQPKVKQKVSKGQMKNNPLYKSRGKRRR